MNRRLGEAPGGETSQTQKSLFGTATKVFDLYVTDRLRVRFVIDHDIIVSCAIGPHSLASK